MNLIESCYLNNHKSIVLSKINAISLGKLPKIKSITIFFIINIKQYKKNLLLFYIIINLMFGGLLFIKTNIRNSLYIVKVILKQRKKFFFLQAFINFYLPLLSFMDNVVKIGTFHYEQNKSKDLVYRLNYFAFPVIPETEALLGNYELLYNFISNYKMQLDILVLNGLYTENSSSFLLRMYRLPCNFKRKMLTE